MKTISFDLETSDLFPTVSINKDYVQKQIDHMNDTILDALNRAKLESAFEEIGLEDLI